VHLLDNLRVVLAAVRRARIGVFFVPHRRWEPGDYGGLGPSQSNPTLDSETANVCQGKLGRRVASGLRPAARRHRRQRALGSKRVRQYRPRFPAQTVRYHARHYSRFAGQHLHESTSRFAMELGYHVTLVRDATAAFNRDMMRAAHELNGPTFAHAILKTSELIAALDRAGIEAQP
jgi:nicotinamidase-related amidase